MDASSTRSDRSHNCASADGSAGPSEGDSGGGAATQAMVYGDAYVAYVDGGDVVISVTHAGTCIVELIRACGEIAYELLQEKVLPQEEGEGTVPVEVMIEFRDEWDMARVTAIRVT